MTRYPFELPDWFYQLYDTHVDVDVRKLGVPQLSRDMIQSLSWDFPALRKFHLTSWMMEVVDVNKIHALYLICFLRSTFPHRHRISEWDLFLHRVTYALILRGEEVSCLHGLCGGRDIVLHKWRIRG